ncbi:MAG: copper-translocating P-type ATPase [Rhodothermaceae bacterium]|nr:MAG: copper-translocating P-type ATPase [Rhodothermaceae bacterium]
MPAVAAHTAPPAPETACAHCGLPVGPHPVGDGPYFCCNGCALVYETLQAAGYGETFYRLKAVGGTAPATPAATEIDPLVRSEFDSEAFLAKHTRTEDDGTRSADLFLDGVHCAACVWLVERLPYSVDGVVSARLDLPRARLSVRWDPARTRLSAVADWLARVGYAPHPARAAGASGRTEAERRLLVKMGVCWALAGNVMLLAFTLYVGLDRSLEVGLAAAARWLSLALALPAVLYGGSEFFRRAWASVRHAVQTRSLRHLHMDTPIALGILVGFMHSTWATVTGQGEVWFDSITVLIAALLTARWLQLRSRRLAGDATERLLALLPSMVRRVRPEDGTEEIVPAEAVRPGDVVAVPPGEVIPVDGVVADGRSTVNNAVLTGESRPEDVAAGAAVTAGATNLTAPLRVTVQAAGDATRVGRLLAWVRDAEAHRAPVVLLADRLGGFFVLTVLALAALTAGLWLWLAPAMAARHVVALLVITCPCALGMATPLAMAVASGKAARAGIFVKSEAALERLPRVDAVVLDKTGTLTEGRLTLTAFEGDARALDLAAALETQSNHPLAAALLEARRRPGFDPQALPLDDVEAVAGSGIRGRVDGHAVVVGRPDWVAAQAGPCPAALVRALSTAAGAGHTPVAVAVDGVMAAALAFGDRLRDDSRAVLDALRAEGRTVYLLSGDHPKVVQAVADALALPPGHAHGGVGPEDKQAFVERLRQAGHTVAMVGDGVNDAAALQAADVGIAVHGGSTASLVAADVFMTCGGLQPVADLFAGAARVMGVIRRNLGISLVYNLAGAAAAMAGLVNPLVAAVAMPASSLVVVVSSILQRSFRPAGTAAQADRPARKHPQRQAA